MRTKKAMLLGVILLLMVLLGACAAPAPETVVFADENLETEIRDALGKAVGEAITPVELAGLTELRASMWDITDLSGIEYCTNLVELSLARNQMTDISPLGSLNNLTTLFLNCNHISDVSSLASLTNLTTLFLNNNQISDLSPLASLTNLTTLFLTNNQISDLSPLVSLTNLSTLTLNANQISDLSPLVENSGLGKGDQVWLEGNNLDLSEGSEDLEDIRQLEGRGVEVYY